MNSSFLSKYKPTIILTLALTVFLASCISLPTTTPRSTTTSTPGWVVSTLAGSRIWGAGYQDATGTAEQFRNPTGVAVDSSGNVYVADFKNHRIRKITSEGEVTTFAGSTEGYHDATGEAAQFNYPEDVAVDSFGNLYVADTRNQSIRKITPEGVVSTLAGSTEGYTNATGKAAQFRNPTGVAVDSDGNVYVADRDNNHIRKITSAGVVTTLDDSRIWGADYQDATGTAARFDRPYSVAVDSSGILYVADTINNRIRKIEYK